MGKINEQMLLQIADGDSAAFAELYETTKSDVYGFALSILKNVHEAEDVMQEVYIKIHHSADTYQPQGKPMAWILTITRNLCLNHLRSVRHHEDIDEIHHMLADREEDPLNVMLIDDAMSILDDMDREIVLLHSTTGLKHREIAEILGIPLATCLSKYHRSLKKMKHHLERMER